MWSAKSFPEEAFREMLTRRRRSSPFLHGVKVDDVMKFSDDPSPSEERASRMSEGNRLNTDPTGCSDTISSILLTGILF